MIQIREHSFDPWIELVNYQTENKKRLCQAGATCVFVGTMRDFNDGNSVRSMQLEHYSGMTEKQLANIIDAAKQQWAISDVLLIHRTGEITPSETIVLLVTWAAHRGDAYDANRFIMESLKSKAPFWKKELLADGKARWVEKNTDGYLQIPK
ncbi:MAG: molybdenum cofactor biosynthesis protein MoaE [Methylicorpusculum sp.]|uniref:molybdenum cofactor biosynthesis protein MoaE n=1 Tax=Methylicorpusculum sp. TaxID=2713644 RepID=UPI0027205D28|nr:molybdenum cofactor biosynthesis protein MoaE [Methylicorpusculum sp.]MDO8846509.1 molybdenum cofactor biosynthesis protein MoaE [Methylicorpusculum sp.]MDO8939947.1 molybdenum cofactor biosynthesis protein MoaE [Methylicorpusculum sp.]MDO9240532.1 molybdenum cofactor biosynthesis protein MoaE [Methylicorpusculum sp.]MDP2180522.1 molybdenum cofactor biosynthesis protein MoaE [Methylicorpusculum sp.]MDP2201333.1 molybdenum cofactor biosynthesis protein MoaE [Methylicorpusculum sp.]